MGETIFCEPDKMEEALNKSAIAKDVLIEELVTQLTRARNTLVKEGGKTMFTIALDVSLAKAENFDCETTNG